MAIKILVTGSNGQLGSELKVLSGRYPSWQFIFTDINDLDITDESACVEFCRQHQPHYVINCAAYTAVDKAETDEEAARLINITAVANLVEACKVNKSALVHISTDYVFDGKIYRPYVETDKINPQSVYGLTKNQGEQKALAYERAIVLRTSWLYSSFGNNFVKTMIKLGTEREKLSVIFDQIGTPTYARDLAWAILEIIGKTNDGQCEFEAGIFHFSNEGVCSWYDFAQCIIKLKKLNCKVVPIETKDYPTPATRPYYSVLNKAKIKSTYQIDIPYWENSLEECIVLLND